MSYIKELFFGTLIFLISIIFITILSNIFSNFLLNLKLNIPELIILFIQLFIVISGVYFLRYYLKKIIKNKELFDSIFMLAGPIFSSASLFFSPIIQNIAHHYLNSYIN